MPALFFGWESVHYWQADNPHLMACFDPNVSFDTGFEQLLVTSAPPALPLQRL
jgi:hypothetical protein